MPKVSSYRELMAEQSRAAVRISGADHSSWNGTLGYTDPSAPVDGLAEWNHTIRYNEANVSAPLREMFDNARVHNQDRKTLRSYRKALKTVLHENVHVLAARGSDHFQGEQEYQKPSGRLAEESFTELYSLKKLDDYIDELGLEAIAPGIKAVPTAEVYKRHLPGAQAFADTIGNRSGLGSDEVIRRLATVNAEQKFQVAAAAIYDSSALPALVPSDQRAAAIQRIGEAMKPAFAEIENADAKEPDVQRREAAVAGGAAAQAGYDEARILKKLWGRPAPEANRQRGPQRQQGQQSQESGSPMPQEPHAERADAQRGQSPPQQPQEPKQPQHPESERTDPQPVQAEPQPVQSGGPAQQTTQLQPVEAGVQVEQGDAPTTQAGQPTAVGQQSGHGAGAQGAAPNGAQTQQSGDMQHAMRAGLSGTAPMAAAKPLSADQQGSRRAGSQTGQPRQGPEREN